MMRFCDPDSAWEFLSIIGVVGVGTCLLVALMCWPGVYYRTVSEIQQFEAVRSTIERARNGAALLENAAIQQKVIDSNQWLAKTQYWNHTWFDVFIPDDVENLSPIK